MSALIHETPIFDELFAQTARETARLVLVAIADKPHEANDDPALNRAIDGALQVMRRALDDGLPPCTICDDGDGIDVNECDSHSYCHEHCHDDDHANRAYDAGDHGDQIRDGVDWR